MTIRRRRAESTDPDTLASDGTSPVPEPTDPASRIVPASDPQQDRDGQTITDIARTITESPSLDAALERLAPLLSSLLDFKRLTVFIRHAETDDYDRYYISGTEIAGDQQHDLVSMDDKFFIHFFRAEPVKRFSMEELEEVQRTIGSESTGLEDGLGDCLSAVLTYRDERVGLIVLRASSPDAFTQPDASRLNDVANQIAGIVANTQLAQLRERELAEKRALTQIGQAVSSTLDFAEVARRTAEALKPLIDFERFRVTVIDESTMQGSRMFGWPDSAYVPDHVGQPTWPLRGTSHQLAITTRGPVSIGDHNRDELSRRLPILKRSFDAGLRSSITTPIFHEGRIIASAGIQSEKRPSFSKADVALFESVAIQISPAIVNATLHQQTAEESRRRAILGEIGRIVNSAPDISDVYGQFVKKLRELLPIDRVVIRIVDETGLTATHTYADGMSGPQGGVDSSFNIARTTTAEVVRTRSPLVLSEQNGDDMAARFPHLSQAMQTGLISGVSVPLISGDRVIGVLHTGSTTPNAYGRQEINLLEAVAAQISGAIANSGLRRQAEEQAHKRAVLAEISRVVTSSPDLESTFERFAEEAKKIIRFDRVSVVLLDEEASTLEVAYTEGTPIPGVESGFKTRLKSPVMAETIDRKTTVTHGVTELEKIASNSHMPHIGLESDLKSDVIAPLIWRDSVIGTLYFRSKEPNKYSDDELKIASQIAAQISGAVENSRLHLAAREEATRHAVLGEIGRIVSSSLDIDDIYERFAAAAKQFIPFDRIVVSLIDTELNAVTDAYVAGMAVESTPTGFTDRLSDTIVADMVRDPKTRIYNWDDLLAEPRQAEALKNGLRSLLLVPLCWGDEVIGTLNFRSKSPKAYDAKIAAFAEQIGAQIAGTIASARLHARTRRDAHRQATLAEIGRVVSSSLDMADIFQPLAGKTREIIAFDRLVVTLLDPDRDQVEIAYVEGLAVQSAGLGAVVPLKGTPLAEAARTLRPVVFSLADLGDVATGMEDVASRAAAGLKSHLIAPLIWHNEAIGFLTFESCSETLYSEDESQVAEGIAAQIAGAIANARLHHDLARSTEEQTELAGLARSISEADTLNEILQLTDTTVSRFFDHDRISVSLLNQQSMALTAVFWRGLEIPGIDVGTVIDLGDTIEEFDSWAAGLTETDSHMLKTPLEAGYLRVGFKTTMRAPLRTRDGSIGLIAISSLRADAYSERDHELLIRIAGQVAPAIENLQLYEAAQKEATERTVLAKLGRIATSSLDVTEILEGVSDAARELIRFDRIAIDTLNAAGDGLRMEFVAGEMAKSTPPGIDGPLDPRISALGPHGGGILIDDCAADGPGEAITGTYLLKLGLMSAVSVPLIWDGQLFGVMTMSSRKTHAYSAGHLEIAQKIAAQISGAIANAELHAKSIQLAGEREARIKLDAENRELQEIEQERDRFISTISHELRTPLTSISAFSDLLARNKKGHLDEREIQQIGIVRKNAQRLNILINDLFDVTKINAGSFELNIEEFDARQLLQELSESLSPMFSEKSQTLIVSLPDNDIWVNADRDRIAQVISNLLSNASKYSPEKSQIDLGLRARNGQVCIRVRDRGIGISRDDRRRLFTPFFRADNEETRKVAGTGLGLMVTKSIVEMHGGAIKVTSTPGKGSCFEVEFPEARTGPSPAHIEKMAQADLPAQPVSRLDSLDADPADFPSSS